MSLFSTVCTGTSVVVHNRNTKKYNKIDYSAFKLLLGISGRFIGNRREITIDHSFGKFQRFEPVFNGLRHFGGLTKRFDLKKKKSRRKAAIVRGGAGRGRISDRNDSD